MPEKYVAQQGDCINSIAFDRGFFPDTIWNHADNAELKKKRKDPAVLLPGDIVSVPDKRLKEISKPPEKQHCFKRKGVPKTLRVQIKSNDKPLTNLGYVIFVDDQRPKEGRTDGQGYVVQPIPPNAKEARLQLADGSEFQMQLGHLDPPDTISGIQGRLKALGYYSGPVDGNNSPETEAAVRQFHRAKQMHPTGKASEETSSLLKSLAGH